MREAENVKVRSMKTGTRPKYETFSYSTLRAISLNSSSILLFSCTLLWEVIFKRRGWEEGVGGALGEKIEIKVHHLLDSRKICFGYHIKKRS